jgi:hypothetical protein
MSAPLPQDYATGKDRVASVRWRRQEDAPGARMTEEQLLSIVRNEMESAVLWGGGPANETRRALMNLYLGAVRGDEQPGRSQVRSRVVYETVEWAKPALMQLFFAGPIVAEFTPNGPEDEEQAQQRTDASNYVFLRGNRGFDATLDAINDALIRRIGWQKVWYERSLEVERERYMGKTQEEIAQLLDDPEVELDSASEPYAMTLFDPAQGPVEVPVWDCEITRKRMQGHVCIEAVPPNEIVVNRGARSPYHTSCRFIAHRKQVSESDAMAMGFDPALVHRIPTSSGIWSENQDDIQQATQGFSSLATNERNDSERRIVLSECYVRLDTDGDGISEWWKVFVGGDYGELMLDAEPVPDHCFSRYQVIPLPHTLEGLAVTDSIADLESIETTLRRIGLDNLYNLTQGRYQVKMQGSPGKNAVPMANLKQLANAVPSSWVEVWGENAVLPLIQPEVFAPIQEALAALGEQRRARTGISPEAMGLDPSMISKHVFGAVAQTSAAQQRIVLMALCAAEGLKRTFELIDRCLLMNESQPMQMRLRGKWVAVDPSEWHGKMDAEIAVGITSSSRFEKAINLQSLIQMQNEGRDKGLHWITDENVYNAYAELTAALGFKNSEKFVTRPEEAGEPPPPPEDATVLVASYQHHIDTQRLQLDRAKLALENKEAELEHERDIIKLRIEAADKEIPFDDAWTLRPPILRETPAPGPSDVRTSGAPLGARQLMGEAPLVG